MREITQIGRWLQRVRVWPQERDESPATYNFLTGGQFALLRTLEGGVADVDGLKKPLDQIFGLVRNIFLHGQRMCNLPG